MELLESKSDQGLGKGWKQKWMKVLFFKIWYSNYKFWQHVGRFEEPHGTGVYHLNTYYVVISMLMGEDLGKQWRKECREGLSQDVPN